MSSLLEKVKANLILDTDTDNEILQEFINSAISYAESYQKKVRRILCRQRHAFDNRAGCYYAFVSFL